MVSVILKAMPRINAKYKKFYVLWEEYEKVEQPALAEYKKVKQPAWAEYKKVKQPAWAEYEKVEQAAWDSFLKEVKKM